MEIRTAEFGDLKQPSFGTGLEMNHAIYIVRAIPFLGGNDNGGTMLCGEPEEGLCQPPPVKRIRREIQEIAEAVHKNPSGPAFFYDL